jgi:hypothetical protein
VQQPSALYQTTAYVPLRSVQHQRLDPKRKDLFVKYIGFDSGPGQPCGCPFAIGAAFANSGIDVHAIDTALMTAATGETNLDVALVTNNKTGNYSTENGHIRKSSGSRAWLWSTKGYSFIGTAGAYGSEQPNGVTYSYQMAQDNYFVDKPYRDGGGGIAGNGRLDPIGTTGLEDANDNGTKDSREDKDNDGVLDHDLYMPGSFAQQLTVFDVNNNGRVELPTVTNATQVTIEYTKEQVIKHTITHEIGHAVGMTGSHCACPGTLHDQYSTDWQRDGNLSAFSRGEIKIHNQ